MSLDNYRHDYEQWLDDQEEQALMARVRAACPRATEKHCRALISASIDDMAKKYGHTGSAARREKYRLLGEFLDYDQLDAVGEFKDDDEDVS